MGQLTPAFFFQQENCCQQSTKMRCPPPTKAWSNINTCAGVTASKWAAHLKDRMMELYNTSQNPFETCPYPQESCQHATAKQKLHQSTTVTLRLDFIYYKMMNAPNSTTIQQFSISAKARTPFHLANRSYVVILNLYTYFKFHINHIIT